MSPPTHNRSYAPIMKSTGSQNDRPEPALFCVSPTERFHDVEECVPDRREPEDWAGREARSGCRLVPVEEEGEAGRVQKGISPCSGSREV